MLWVVLSIELQMNVKVNDLWSFSDMEGETEATRLVLVITRMQLVELILLRDINVCYCLMFNF